MLIRREKLLPSLFLAVALALAGCGDSEQKQAQAFADFLQKRILEQPGVHVPILSDEESKALGPFAANFAILKSFNDDLSAALRDYGKAMHAAPGNIAPLDLPKYRPDLMAARDYFSHAPAAIDAALAKAQAAREKLVLPETVKARFDAAYDQLVTRPADAFRETIGPSLGALDAEIAIANFIDAHKAEMKVVGNQMQIAKADLRRQLDALLSAYQAANGKAQEAGRKLEKVAQGN